MKRTIKMLLRIPGVLAKGTIGLIVIAPIVCAGYWLDDDERTIWSAIRLTAYEWRWFLTRPDSAEDDKWWEKRCEAARRMT